MALTVPTLQEVKDFANDQSIPDDGYTQMLRQQGADIFYLATGLTEDPLDTVDARIAKSAILAMISYLYTTNPGLAASYSGYTSERIGNYSYSKKASAAVRGLPTGILLFDLAISHFRSSSESSWSESVSVFDLDDGMLVEDQLTGKQYVFGPKQLADFHVEQRDPSGWV